jgi:hypothetical protein
VEDENRLFAERLDGLAEDARGRGLQGGLARQPEARARREQAQRWRDRLRAYERTLQRLMADEGSLHSFWRHRAPKGLGLSDWPANERDQEMRNPRSRSSSLACCLSSSVRTARPATCFCLDCCSTRWALAGSSATRPPWHADATSSFDRASSARSIESADSYRLGLANASRSKIASNAKLGRSRGPSYSGSTTPAAASAPATPIAGADAPRSAVRSSGGFRVGTSVSTTRAAPLKSGSEVMTLGRSLSGSGVSKSGKPGPHGERPCR